jgi:hypothetical protein
MGEERGFVAIRVGGELMRDEDNIVYQWALTGDWVAVRDYLGKRILSAEARKKLLALPDIPLGIKTFLIERGGRPPMAKLIVA